MAHKISPRLRVRVRGPLACFTRPELKVERVSYPVMTPSAARGVIEAILWKPAIAWRIHRIEVLSEIRFTAFRRNEVNSRAVRPPLAVVAHGGALRAFFADEPEERAQRNTVALRDVDYLVEASFMMTERAGASDNVQKFVETFERRVQKGQHFHQPYLGCREFIAEALPTNGAPKPVDDSRDLGLMLWDIVFGPNGNRAAFFPARLDRGVLEVPESPEAGGAS